MQLIKRLSERRFWDELIPLMLAVYAFCIFIPRGVTALERLALGIAVLVTLCGGRWRHALPYLRHSILLLLLLFVLWQGVTASWSLDADETLSSAVSVFKDYFLILPPLLFVMSQPVLRGLLFRYFAYCALVVMLLNGGQYVQEILTDPALLQNFKLHRGWSHPLIFFFPFVLLQWHLAAGRESRFRWFWLLALILAVLMIIATGARAAWLAILMVGAVWLALEFNWRRFLQLAFLALCVGLVSYLTVPFVQMKVKQGLDTSGRVGGVWTAAVDMISDRPVLGYGFSKKIYNQEFLRRLDGEPHWTVRRAIGPHSNYLEIAFAGGLVGLGFLLSLYLAAICSYVGSIRICQRAERHWVAAPFAAFAGFYVVRGGFESVRWAPLVIPLACLVHFSWMARAARAKAA